MAKTQMQAANDNDLIAEHEVVAALAGCVVLPLPRLERGLSACEKAMAEQEIDTLMAKAGEDVDRLMAVAETAGERERAALLIQAAADVDAARGDV